MAGPGSSMSQICWWLASLGLFVGSWEVAYISGLYTGEALPPPHVFLSHFNEQAAHFDFGSQMPGEAGAASAIGALLSAIGSTAFRVTVGLSLGFVLGVGTGLSIRYCKLFGRLVLPTLTLLAPVSPFAWLPVSIYLFGTGDAPSIFLVFIAVYFIITLSTIAEIDHVSETFINVGRIMGATRLQMLRTVVVPAILPGLFLILRLNLFVAWMIVLIAESAGARNGLGAVVMLARNTANSELVFLGITVVGVVAFLFDAVLRYVQGRILFWTPESRAGARP